MSEDARKITERECAHLRSRYVLMYNDKQIEMLDNAVDFAVKMHEGQSRASGEPYITHPIAVAGLLLDIGLDSPTIAARCCTLYRRYARDVGRNNR